MRHVYRILTVPVGVIGLIFLSAFQVFAENIYHWKDRNGVSCYSNTSVPNGVREFSVMFTTWPGSKRIEAPDIMDSVDEGAVGAQAGESSSPVLDSRASVLRGRIEDRRASIQHIESLIETHPGDSGLRNSLYKKKQYLQEDLIRLKLITK